MKNQTSLFSLLFSSMVLMNPAFADHDLNQLPIANDTSVYKITHKNQARTVEKQERVMYISFDQELPLTEATLNYSVVSKENGKADFERTQKSIAQFIKYFGIYTHCEKMEAKSKGQIKAKRVNAIVNQKTIKDACEFTELSEENFPVTTTISPDVANWIIYQEDPTIKVELIRDLKTKRETFLEKISISS